MPIQTLSNLRDTVLVLTQELQKEVDFNENRIDAYIDQGHWDFLTKIGGVEDVIDITTVADQVEYTQSDNSEIGRIYQIHEVRHIENGVTEQGRKLRPYPGGANNLPEEYVYGRPDFYWTRGMQSEDVSTNDAKRFGTWPVDGTSSNTIRLYVSRFPLSTLSSDGDSVEIPGIYAEAPAIYAALRFFQAFSHRKQQYRLKAIDLKRQYEELVHGYNYRSAVEEGDGFGQTIDVYDGNSNWE